MSDKNLLLDYIENNSWDWNSLESFSALMQGKGWGTSTIDEEINCCTQLLNYEPKLIVDIGANKGLYTEKLLTVFPNATYFLFEPSQHNIKILTDKFYNFNDVYCSSYALSNKSSIENLYADQIGSGLSSLKKRRLDHFNIFMNAVESVNAIRFDEFLNFEDIPNCFNTIDYVKIDIEGYELFALEGFGDRILDVNLIQFEFGGCNIDTKTYFQDFWYFFNNINFSIYRISPEGPIKINYYDESLEYFSTTNYIALNKNLQNDIV
jgi:FkbM family methyltransferase